MGIVSEVKISYLDSPTTRQVKSLTTLRVNMAAAAAANRVHWMVPDNLFRKPETHAHLEHRSSLVFSKRRNQRHTKARHTKKVQPEHGCDHLPGEREDAHPDKGEGDGLQKLVELVVRKSCRETDTNVNSRRHANRMR